MVKFDGKKVLVWPFQAQSTKGKEVVIGEERQTRMIRPTIQKLVDGRRMREASHNFIQKSPLTSSWLNTEMARPASRVVKTRPSGFPGSGQYFYGREFVRRPIQDTTVIKFRRSGSSPTGESFDALLPVRATNAWLWGPPPMMYPPCPPWVEWCSPWTPSPMHFHPGWSRLVEGFGHGGYYTRDDRDESVGHQQDRKASTQENRTFRNVKPDHPVSPKAIAASGQ
jgi:hypothetical protein